MAICPRTGITIPECSCSTCLEAQIRRHRPGAGEPEIGGHGVIQALQLLGLVRPYARLQPCSIAGIGEPAGVDIEPGTGQHALRAIVPSRRGHGGGVARRNEPAFVRKAVADEIEPRGCAQLHQVERQMRPPEGAGRRNKPRDAAIDFIGLDHGMSELGPELRGRAPQKRLCRVCGITTPALRHRQQTVISTMTPSWGWVVPSVRP